MKKRLLTGDRPTGRLHLGHWVGSIRNRVRLQDEYECFFIVADLHTLTTKPEKEAIPAVPGNIRPMVLDYLAAGIDPEHATIFAQTAGPANAELQLIVATRGTLPRLAATPRL